MKVAGGGSTRKFIRSRPHNCTGISNYQPFDLRYKQIGVITLS